MIKTRRSDERGHANHGWLDSYHTFSFGNYYDPEFMGFGHLRVINQDRVEPGRGFGTHGHRDMEIVSYVLSGVLEHKDSMGHGSQMRPGEVQIMSAGTGVTHSEFNASNSEPLQFLQMWIQPSSRGTEPRYEQRAFEATERRGRLRLVVAPDGAEGAVRIGQDARMFAGLLDDRERIEHEIGDGRAAWIHLARGRVILNGEQLEAGDGAAIRDETKIVLEGIEDAEVVLWDVPE